MKKRIFIFLIICFSFFIIFSGCSNSKKETLKNGYYTAEKVDYNQGWKEFVTICVKGEKIVSIEYNAKNESGFIKSWDMAYMRNMNSVQGIYPNKYTRTYGANLLETQNSDEIDVITGATESYVTFKALSNAVLEKAKQGDTSIAFVKVTE